MSEHHFDDDHEQKEDVNICSKGGKGRVRWPQGPERNDSYCPSDFISSYFSFFISLVYVCHCPTFNPDFPYHCHQNACLLVSPTFHPLFVTI